MRATIKSMARELGISHMTVSRALSGSEHVNAHTRERVLAHAKAVGYVRSSAAGAMRGDPTAIVGLLLPNIVNEFYAQLANALGTLCAKADLDLVIHLTGDSLEREWQCLTRLHALQARVVLRVPAPRESFPPVETRVWPPVIDLIREADNDERLGALLIDDAGAIEQAVAALAARGCERVAYLGGPASLSSGRQRAQAFERGMQRAGLILHTDLIQTGPPGLVFGHQRMQCLLDLAEPPDAVLCAGFEISNGALTACLERRISMPESLAFVGYGDPPFYRWIAGGISTVSLSAEQVAYQTLQMMNDAAVAGAARRVVSAVFVQRASS